jgi:2-amino-4-hydroxy-6-hydroxymethyldihydropteridine diphosphokinase
MSLILALGSNLGNSIEHLQKAESLLTQHFILIARSRIYVSKAVDYINQPDFFNLVLEFSTPTISPTKTLEIILSIEKEMGRERIFKFGPRVIDIDIIFFDFIEVNSDNLTLPHPKWLDRSFIIRPFQELPFFKSVKECFTIPTSFDVEATPLT